VLRSKWVLRLPQEQIGIIRRKHMVYIMKCSSFPINLNTVRLSQGPRVALATFYAARHVIWELPKARKANIFCNWRKSINIHTLSKRENKPSQKKYFDETNLKSRCYAKVHCSVVQTTWNLTKQYKYYCGINNWSFIKLIMAWNQNCLKVNKQRLYNKLSCMEKYIYYPLSSEYQLYSLR
jgi:hypothetical protein